LESFLHIDGLWILNTFLFFFASLTRPLADKSVISTLTPFTPHLAWIDDEAAEVSCCDSCYISPSLVDLFEE